MTNCVCAVDWNALGTWVGAIGSVFSGATAIVVTFIAITTYKKALIAYKAQAKINEEVKAITVHKIDIISRIATVMYGISEDLIYLKSVCNDRYNQINPQSSDLTFIYGFLNEVIVESETVHKNLVAHTVKMKSLQIEMNIFYSSLSIGDEKLNIIEQKIIKIVHNIVAISKTVNELIDRGELAKRNNCSGDIISFVKHCCLICDKLDTGYVDFILDVKNELKDFLQN